MARRTILEQKRFFSLDAILPSCNPNSSTKKPGQKPHTCRSLITIRDKKKTTRICLITGNRKQWKKHCYVFPRFVRVDKTRCRNNKRTLQKHEATVRRRRLFAHVCSLYAVRQLTELRKHQSRNEPSVAGKVAASRRFLTQPTNNHQLNGRRCSRAVLNKVEPKEIDVEVNFQVFKSFSWRII